METIALRFSDNFAPAEGTICLHNEIINKNGFVWYGKFGSSLSKNIIETMLKQKEPKFLLIKSGGIERYWVYFTEIKNEIPELDKIPEYYRNNTEKIKCWFKVIKFEKADPNVMSKCNLISTGQILSLASKYSMSPYFKIKYEENGE